MTAGQREDNYRNIRWITFHWVIIGLLAFGFESILLFHTKSIFNHLATFLWYVVPPIVFGLPFLIMEKYLVYNWIKRLDFKVSLLVRMVLYLTGIVGVYAALQFLVINIFEAGHPFIEPSLEKFVYVWAIGSVFTLVFNSLSERLDPATFKSWLMGEFHKPKEEERVFLFCDINESTPIAESLGSGRYFKFLDMIFSLTTPVIQEYQGEIYQYVGDEIVISWPIDKALPKNNALQLFFRLSAILEKNTKRFIDEFGYKPVIKGSLHFGEITKGELGWVKKELIYTGDVLNSAARMHSICKKINASLVISKRLLDLVSDLSQYTIKEEGHYKLPGKNESLFLYSVSEKEPVS